MPTPALPCPPGRDRVAVRRTARRIVRLDLGTSLKIGLSIVCWCVAAMVIASVGIGFAGSGTGNVFTSLSRALGSTSTGSGPGVLLIVAGIACVLLVLASIAIVVTTTLFNGLAPRIGGIRVDVLELERQRRVDDASR